MRDYYLWCNTIFWQKIQNCYFLLNSVQNLIRNCRTRWWFSFFFFTVWKRKYGFFANLLFTPKNQNCQFRMKFGTQTNSNIHNSMVMFIFSVFDQKYHFFWKFKFIQNIKIVFWNRNAEPRLIWICKIWWSFSFFSFFIGYTLFRLKDLPFLPFFWSKNSKLLV